MSPSLCQPEWSTHPRPALRCPHLYVSFLSGPLTCTQPPLPSPVLSTPEWSTHLYVSAYLSSPDIGSDPGDRTKMSGVRADESWKHLQGGYEVYVRQASY